MALLAGAAASAWQALHSWRRDRVMNGSGGAPATHRLELFALIGRRVRAAGVRVPALPGLGEHAATPAGSATLDLADARAGSLTVFGCAGLAAALVTGSLFGCALGLGCLGFGWLFPDLWMRAAVRARADQIERQAPLALDLIASAVAAGIPVDEAMGVAAEVSSGPLHDELETALVNLRLGHRRHAELTDLAGRTASPSLRRLGSALRMSDRLGVPLSPVLRSQAARARAEHTRQTHERAARAAPRILLVVVFVLVPAAVLPVMTALALVAAHSVGPVISGRM